jgi:hypothetical protein
MNPKTCGICRNLQHPDTVLARLRLTAEDIRGQAIPVSQEPGLYHTCPKCLEFFAPTVRARVGKVRWIGLVAKIAFELAQAWMHTNPGQVPDMKALHEQAEAEAAKVSSPGKIEAEMGANDLM